MTDYHELPEVPRCCGTCKRLDIDLIDGEPASGHHKCGRWGKHVAPHGLCSQWERRDD